MVCKLRKSRGGAIQTQDQWKFLLKALLAHLAQVCRGWQPDEAFIPRRLGGGGEGVGKGEEVAAILSRGPPRPLTLVLWAASVQIRSFQQYYAETQRLDQDPALPGSHMRQDASETMPTAQDEASLAFSSLLHQDPSHIVATGANHEYGAHARARDNRYAVETSGRAARANAAPGPVPPGANRGSLLSC